MPVVKKTYQTRFIIFFAASVLRKMDGNWGSRLVDKKILQDFDFSTFSGIRPFILGDKHLDLNARIFHAELFKYASFFNFVLLISWSFYEIRNNFTPLWLCWCKNPCKRHVKFLQAKYLPSLSQTNWTFLDSLLNSKICQANKMLQFYT